MDTIIDTLTVVVQEPSNDGFMFLMILMVMIFIGFLCVAGAYHHMMTKN